MAALAPIEGTARADDGARRPILLVVAANSPVNNLSLDDVKRIFGGGAIDFRPLNLPPGAAERVDLDRILFSRTPDEVARYWLDRKIRGQGGPPRVIPSGHLVARIVARVPGTIGYVAETALPAGTKALRVNGLSPADPRYPLVMQPRPSP